MNVLAEVDKIVEQFSKLPVDRSVIRAAYIFGYADGLSAVARCPKEEREALFDQVIAALAVVKEMEFCSEDQSDVKTSDETGGSCVSSGYGRAPGLAG